jgi:hypothetical protein
MDYTLWLKQAEDRLTYLKQQQEVIAAEIAKLEQGIASFKPLVAEPGAWGGVEVGFTQAVREIIGVHPVYGVTATAIRDEMVNRGVKLEQANPLAAIHQVLARLLDRIEIEELPQPEGKPRYRRMSTIQQIGKHMMDAKKVK